MYICQNNHVISLSCAINTDLPKGKWWSHFYPHANPDIRFCDPNPNIFATPDFAIFFVLELQTHVEKHVTVKK